MLYYNIIDVFESIDANETSASKEYIIYHYWYFSDKGLRFNQISVMAVLILSMMSIDINRELLNKNSQSIATALITNIRKYVFAYVYFISKFLLTIFVSKVLLTIFESKFLLTIFQSKLLLTFFIRKFCLRFL